MLHFETVDEGTLVLLKKLQSLAILSEMRLVGGTSLALQIGHRKSIDIDLFGNLAVDYAELVDELKSIGNVISLKTSKNIHSFIIDEVKVDIVNYNYEWLSDKKVFEGIHLATVKDIAAMKLNAIIGRGSKKDFVDLFYILKEFLLTELIEFYNLKYMDGSKFLVIKSLAYFEDADNEEMPFMFQKITWEEVKNNIIKAHTDYVLKYE